MNTKEQLENITDRIVEIHKEEEAISVIRNEHLKTAGNLVRQLIKEDKLLGKCKWTLTLNRSGFTLNSDVEDAGVKELLKLIDKVQSGGWYHFDFQLLDGDGKVYFNDGEVTMYFDNIESISRICDEYGMKFDTEHIDRHMKNASEDLIKYKEIKKVLERYTK